MWFGWGWGMMFFIPLCFIFGAIAIYYFFFTSKRSCHSNYTPRYETKTSPSEILAERYARGEISRDEFQEMRKQLDR